MIVENSTKTEFLVVDTSAFIKNANLQDLGQNIITAVEVLNEIKSKRQIRRLVVLPYDLQVKDAFTENVKYVTEFSKSTGDYPSLSATDLKVIALTYQLEKEHVGTEHLRAIPEVKRTVDYCNFSAISAKDIAGFYDPKKGKKNCASIKSEKCGNIETEDLLDEKLDNLNIDSERKIDSQLNNENERIEISNTKLSLISSENKDNFVLELTTSSIQTEDSKTNENDLDSDTAESSEDKTNENDLSCDFGESSVSGNEPSMNIDEILVRVENEEEINDAVPDMEDEDDDYDEDDDSGWITVNNIKQVKQQMDADTLDDKPVRVACLTMDFAMQNVLKQMGLNVASLDGRVIKHLRTFILRCYGCFKTTSVMTKIFCPHCGNKTLKKVAVSLDADGNQKVHINLRRPITARGKKFSLPKPRGGKHDNYPLLFEDQPVPQQRPTRLARMKSNPLETDYIAGFSPFVMRDVNSKSAMLGIPNNTKEVKYWMRKNPNASCRTKKK